MKKTGMTLFVAGLTLLPTMAMSNDFSTVTRVQYVMDCMDANPKMNVYEAVHKCSCVADKLAAVFTQREFEDINAGFMYRNLPADRGAMLRDDKDLSSGVKLFKKTHSEAYQSCRIR